jgi:hypothetical protein
MRHPSGVVTRYFKKIEETEGNSEDVLTTLEILEEELCVESAFSYPSIKNSGNPLSLLLNRWRARDF